VKDWTKIAWDMQTEFFVYEGIPFRIADSPKLRVWLEALIKCGIASVATRKQMVGVGHERAELVRQRVVETLQASEGVTVGVDGWTNVNGHKVLNLCPVAGGVAYYWNSVVIKTAAAAVNQEGPIVDAINALIAKSVRVTAIVTDNEKVNTTLHKLLLPTFPFLLHVPCAAHTIQLCCKYAMKLKRVFVVCDTLMAVLAAYKASKKLRISLEALQRLLHAGKPPLKIVKPNDTRWNSLLLAGQRLLELESSITPYTADIKTQLAATKSRVKRERWSEYALDQATFWEPLKSLATFLVPFKAATDVVQSDASTPIDIHQQFVRLINHTDSLSYPHMLFPLRTKLLNIIKLQWNTHVNVNTIITSAHLSFDPSYDDFSNEQKTDAAEWFIQWGVEYLSYYRLANHTDRAKIEDDISRQYGEFNRQSGSFAHLKGRHDKLAAAHYDRESKKPNNERRRYSARSTWQMCMVHELTTLALALLSVTASEAAVERSFSRQGLVHSKLRNRLSDDSVHMQMFFSFNSRALEQPDDHAPSCTPLDEDEETRKGTSLLSSAGYFADDEIIAAASESEDDVEAERVMEEKAEAGEMVIAEDLVDAADQLDLLEADFEEEKEEEAEKNDEKEEKEQPQVEEKTQAQKMEEFAQRYCVDNRIMRGHQWPAWKRGILEGHVIAAGLKIPMDDVLIRIKQIAGERNK
jgi:hypothetical protein